MKMKHDKDDENITIKKLAKRLNITEQTYYNWKKTKPELISLIHMGLELEKFLNKFKS